MAVGVAVTAAGGWFLYLWQFGGAEAVLGIQKSAELRQAEEMTAQLAETQVRVTDLRERVRAAAERRLTTGTAEEKAEARKALDELADDGPSDKLDELLASVRQRRDAMAAAAGNPSERLARRLGYLLGLLGICIAGRGWWWLDRLPDPTPG